MGELSAEYQYRAATDRYYVARGRRVLATTPDLDVALELMAVLSPSPDLRIVDRGVDLQRASLVGRELAVAS